MRDEALRLRSISCTSNLWKNERGAIEQEVARDLSDPEYIFSTHLLVSQFQGTRPSFDGTTAAMLRSFHDCWHAPNHDVLVVAGDVPLKEILENVKAIFIPPARDLVQVNLGPQNDPGAPTAAHPHSPSPSRPHPAADRP